MRLTIDEKKLKELDKYNLFRILEKASLGNVARCSIWTVNKVAEIVESFSKPAGEKSKDEKEAKTDNKE